MGIDQWQKRIKTKSIQQTLDKILIAWPHWIQTIPVGQRHLFLIFSITSPLLLIPPKEYNVILSSRLCFSLIKSFSWISFQQIWFFLILILILIIPTMEGPELSSLDKSGRSSRLGYTTSLNTILYHPSRIPGMRRSYLMGLQCGAGAWVVAAAKRRYRHRNSFSFGS